MTGHHQESPRESPDEMPSMCLLLQEQALKIHKILRILSGNKSHIYPGVVPPSTKSLFPQKLKWALTPPPNLVYLLKYSM